MKKRFSITLAVLALVCLLTCMMVMVGCGETDNDEEYYDPNTTYEVIVETMGKTVISGVTVSVYNSSNEKVAETKTNVRGKARFTDIDLVDYTAVIDETTLPKGFYIPDGENTLSLSATNMQATIKVPSSIIDETVPSTVRYSVGDVAYNFTTTSVDKNGQTKQISLASYLSRYNAVVLNFWYASCSPCLNEFPYMNEAYLDYQDEIAVIAINSGAETESEVVDFVASVGYVFDFVKDSGLFSTYNTAFNVKAYPTTVVIDRYGIIAHIESGSIPSTSTWKNLFDHYIADDYEPDYSVAYTDTDSSGSNLTKPDIEMASSEEIAAVVTNTNANELTNIDTFNFTQLDGDDAEYSWPWVITEKDGVSCLQTSNAGRVSSYSGMLVNVKLKAGQQIFFDYFASSELDADMLYVQVDTVLQYTISGEDSAWHTNQLLYVALQDGTYQISLIYQKDATTNTGDDCVYIKNLHVDDGAQIDGHVDLLYNATTNYTADETLAENYPVVPEEDEDYKGYINHVAYYLNETDGFYHVALSGDANVKSESDPILYADLYYSTPWNRLSVWNLAYYSAGLFNSQNDNYIEGHYQAIEDYAWIQTNNDSRYVPLNKELHDILVDVVSDPALGRSDNSQDPHNGVDQWLEMCRYYVHYGTDEEDDVCYAHDNTVEALKWRVAKDYGTMSDDTLVTYTDLDGNVYEDVFVINVDVYSVHLPRGNYYRFTTTKAGAYLIRSVAPCASDYDVNGIDALGFLCDERGNILAENDNYKIEIQGYGKDDNGDVQEGVARYALYDNNFYLYVYLEADTTYHVAGCFNDPYATGQYDVTISYLGETAYHFTSCATDPAYTYDENDENFTPIIVPQMGKDRFYIGDDGNYYAQEFDGSQGSLLYIRLIGPTYLNSYTSYTLEEMIESGGVGSTLAEQIYMRDLLVQSRENYLLDENGNKLYGYVVATQKLVSILNTTANGSDTEDSTTYSQTSWLLTAYYYRQLNELTLAQAKAQYGE